MDINKFMGLYICSTELQSFLKGSVLEDELKVWEVRSWVLLLGGELYYLKNKYLIVCLRRVCKIWSLGMFEGVCDIRFRRMKLIYIGQ